jgi:hypothetical protein
MGVGAIPKDDRTPAAWQSAARPLAAYRDRYQITGANPLRTPPETDAQKIHAARTKTSLDRACRFAIVQVQSPETARRVDSERSEPRL